MSDQKRFYFSKSLDACAHMAFEDLILRETSETCLFLWYTGPSVVLGKYQNPYAESRWQDFSDMGVRLLRRQSGGGTVFHDSGNLNFCFIGDLCSFDKRKNLEFIQEALLRLGRKIEINERFDLLEKTKKVSGSAFKQTKDRALHHGTLLLRSELDTLRGALRPYDSIIETKAVSSVRSSVTNLGLDVDQVIESCACLWKEIFSESQEKEVSISSLKDKKAYERFSSWEWIWGGTPRFIWKSIDQRIIIEVEKGLIKRVEGDAPSELLIGRKIGIKPSEIDGLCSLNSSLSEFLGFKSKKFL